tara:strand:- start:1202 stop:1552 length:351 start_codon:yes stop_codon:yes gene_type:complete
MKITRHGLKDLIKEVVLEKESVLLEMPGLSTTGSKMHAHDPKTNDPKGEDPAEDDGEMVKRSLYHMSQQAQQLHDMLHGDENLEEWVKTKITKAAASLEGAFKAIVYDKGPGQGRL